MIRVIWAALILYAAVVGGTALISAVSGALTALGA